ncbi:MAG: hypothetical protein WC728_16685 [Elusimicrobiota bacterium]
MILALVLTAGIQLPQTPVPVPALPVQTGQQTQGLASIRGFLSKQEVIRVFISPAPGNGHQAASATVIKRLRELGYKGSIEAVYQDSVKRKLPYLLPGFREDGPDSQALDGGITALSFSRFTASPPQRLEVGISGADEDFLPRHLPELGVHHLLQLQPMNWSFGQAIITQEEQTRVASLDHLSRLGYVYDIPKRADPRAFLARQLPGSAKLQGLNAVFDTAGRHELMPVYGVGLQNGTAKLGSLLRAVSLARPSRGVVVPVFSDIEAGSLKRMPGVEVLPVTDPSVEKRLQDLRPGEILVLLTGTVPQDVFEFIYSQATLPAVVAGLNARNLMRLLGLPYFRTVFNDERKGLVGFFGEEALKTPQDPAMLLVAAANKEVASASESLENAARFIAESMRASSPVRRLFDTLGRMGRTLADDKLAQGLLALIGVARESQAAHRELVPERGG